ncbi:efflux RND transporter periplasmic adaptor subunit [Paenibacillus pinihumi]|uniref:efflux RND transporter periplasmic adaptor subunit n=1 Tax=Paenibacillus pinihumi TaxID=669462 RepID=UPI0004109A60|nr:biotin/lipoyl-binding protein [Paenibacillus pinihumi]
MELQSNEQAAAGRKRKIRLIAGLFIGMLIVFSLFSNTLASLTLPKVALTTPGRGQLDHTFEGSGLVKWKTEVQLTNPAGWKVQQIKVKPGDAVKKGQTLVAYDKSAAEQQILDEQASLKKLKLSITELQHNYIEASKSGEDKNVDDAKRALDLSAIDADTQERRIQKLQNDLKSNRELIAPFDGFITKVNALEGLVSGGSPDVVVSNGELGFEFSFTAPSDAAAALNIGDSLNVQVVTGGESRQIEGVIADIRNADLMNQDGGGGEGAGLAAGKPMKQLVLTLKDQQLKGGEQAQVELVKSLRDVILVPNKAIHDEGDKKYVLGVEQRDGPLGNAFYVRKVYVKVADANESVSAVTEGLFDQESIILESSDPLQEGDKIRMQ